MFNTLFCIYFTVCEFPTVTQGNLDQALKSYFCKICFNIIT